MVSVIPHDPQMGTRHFLGGHVLYPGSFGKVGLSAGDAVYQQASVTKLDAVTLHSHNPFDEMQVRVLKTYDLFEIPSNLLRDGLFDMLNQRRVEHNHVTRLRAVGNVGKFAN